MTAQSLGFGGEMRVRVLAAAMQWIWQRRQQRAGQRKEEANEKIFPRPDPAHKKTAPT
ncbi:hypothetical protein [Aeromonas enteropelogenes]|uniref:hypothetical protein n=1 Tax=Aeromonas enteropelogenes TaxID=29489 RepID=UPI003F74410A